MPEVATCTWNVERLRELTGRTQQELADGTGLGRTTIWRIERNAQNCDADSGPYGIKRLVVLYRYFWRQGRLALDGPDQPPRRVTLCDILLVSDLPPCRGSRPIPPSHVRPVRNLPGVWWNLHPLRLELSAQLIDQPRVTIKNIAAALDQSADSLGEIESSGAAGTIALLVRATRFFAQHLRPEISLEDVLIVLPRLPAPAAEMGVSAT